MKIFTGGKMKKASFILGPVLGLCLSSTIVVARITDTQDFFSTICIGDQSVGFDWENNSWTPKRFVPEKFLIKKINIIKDDKAGTVCKPKLMSSKRVDLGENGAFEYGCYNVMKVGGEYYPYSSKVCSEIWQKKNGKLYLYVVDCDDIKFSPNGHFHQSSIHAGIEEKEDYKDSMAVSVGSCSSLQQN